MSYALLRPTEKTPEKLPRRERLNLQQRDEILKTALKLFSEKSYPNVSMQRNRERGRVWDGDVIQILQ